MRIKLENRDVVEQIRKALRKEVQVFSQFPEHNWNYYTGNISFHFGDWLITFYNDCYSLDYCDEAKDSNGKSGSFAEWQVNPVDLLTQEELSQLEELLKMAEGKTNNDETKSKNMMNSLDKYSGIINRISNGILWLDADNKNANFETTLEFDDKSAYQVIVKKIAAGGMQPCLTQCEFATPPTLESGLIDRANKWLSKKDYGGRFMAVASEDKYSAYAIIRDLLTALKSNPIAKTGE